jgi:hypothetical protein
MWFSLISAQTAIIPHGSMKRLLFTIETTCVHCAVRVEYLHIIEVILSLNGLKTILGLIEVILSLKGLKTILGLIDIVLLTAMVIYGYFRTTITQRKQVEGNVNVNMEPLRRKSIFIFAAHSQK